MEPTEAPSESCGYREPKRAIPLTRCSKPHRTEMATLAEQLGNIRDNKENRIRHLESDRFRLLEKADAGERDCTMELVTLLRYQQGS
jgi:hypothetical protein